MFDQRMLMAALGIALAFLGGRASAQPVGVPQDFSIRLESSARVPGQTPPDVQSVEIKSDGQTILSQVHRGDKNLPVLTITIPDVAVRRIFQAINDQRFFDLKETYTDDEIRGGDRAQITVTAGGKARTVNTVNIRVNAFDAIAKAVNAELPADRRIRYNALTEDSYKAVDR